MSFATEFREFAMKGNVVDLAVGVIIGAAFGKIVDSIVGDLIMPIVGPMLRFARFPQAMQGRVSVDKPFPRHSAPCQSTSEGQAPVSAQPEPLLQGD